MKEKEVKRKEDGGATTVVTIPGRLALEHATPAGLANIGIPTIRTLAKMFSPSVIHPRIEELGDDLAAYLPHLRSQEGFGESRFWTFMSLAGNGMQNNALEILEAEGEKLNPGEHESEFFARLFETKKDRIEMILLDVASKTFGDISGRTYHVFQSTIPQLELAKAFPKITPAQLRGELLRELKNGSYGEFCEILQAKHGSGHAFLVDRGGRRGTDAAIDQNEQPQFRIGRKRITDFIFYQPECHQLWIGSSAKDAVMYATVIGEILGAPIAFRRRETVDLSPFMNKRLGSELTRIANAIQVARVEVRELHVDIQSDLHKMRSGRGPCLTDRYWTSPYITAKNSAKAVKIRFVFDPNGKDYADVSLSTGTLRVLHGADPQMIHSALSLLRVWKPYETT